ncbi:DNA-dependent metalloprotease SPRTN-like [Watersipora subatra]|uniref:DNA-dependent metalloprotease SPRTN-like n=1 Tax=Watersipora subatra TaxID=2589382 RepID=UPI00355B5C10
MSDSLVSADWELIDPTPNPVALFAAYNNRFFWGKLNSVVVSWSPRMTSCAGICCYEGRGGLCSIKLSTPLLKLRPRKDLVETLLHEMIHAYLFITQNNKDREGHGPEFQKHMRRINAEAKTNITIYHSFHNEVRHYQNHVWKCNGPCRNRKPFFGMLRRATNRAPGPNDFWWKEHQSSCGGTYIKVAEPTEFTERQNKKKKQEAKKKKEESKSTSLITNYFKSPKHTSSQNDRPTTNARQNKPKFTGFNTLGGHKDNNIRDAGLVRKIPGFGKIPVRVLMHSSLNQPSSSGTQLALTSLKCSDPPVNNVLATNSERLEKTLQANSATPLKPSGSSQFPATHSVTRQPTATHSVTRQPTATHSVTRQPTATHSVTRQPTATHSVTRQPTDSYSVIPHSQSPVEAANPKLVREVGLESHVSDNFENKKTTPFALTQSCSNPSLEKLEDSSKTPRNKSSSSILASSVDSSIRRGSHSLKRPAAKSSKVPLTASISLSDSDDDIPLLLRPRSETNSSSSGIHRTSLVPSTPKRELVVLSDSDEEFDLLLQEVKTKKRMSTSGGRTPRESGAVNKAGLMTEKIHSKEPACHDDSSLMNTADVFDGYVECPACTLTIAAREINAHLDNFCLSLR